MPINVQDLINILADILEEKNLKAALKSSLQGGMITGIFAFLGGVLLGPLGLAVGGAIGGTTAAVKYQNSFRPVALIVKELSFEKKEKLCMRVKHAFRNFGVQDFAALATILLSNTSLQEIAIQEVSRFLTSEMGYSIQS